MSTPSSDDKILQLVRAILDAVDARLATVRREFADSVEQMEQRHRQVLDALAAFDRRLNSFQSGAVTSATATAPTTSPGIAARPTGSAPSLPSVAAPSVPTAPPAPAAAPAPAPTDRSDAIDMAEVTRLVQERLANLQLPSLDAPTEG